MLVVDIKLLTGRSTNQLNLICNAVLLSYHFAHALINELDVCAVLAKLRFQLGRYLWHIQRIFYALRLRLDVDSLCVRDADVGKTIRQRAKLRAALWCNQRLRGVSGDIFSVADDIAHRCVPRSN